MLHVQGLKQSTALLQQGLMVPDGLQKRLRPSRSP